MQPRGRVPQPTAVKKAKGNPGQRKLNDEEPKPEVEAPPCPDFLSEYAREEWESIVPILLRNGLLTSLDGAALAAYCAAYGRWREAEEQIASSGIVIKMGDKGYIVQSPWLQVANKAIKQIEIFVARFGLSPSDRTRIHVKPCEPVEPDEKKKKKKKRAEAMLYKIGQDG